MKILYHIIACCFFCFSSHHLVGVQCHEVNAGEFKASYDTLSQTISIYAYSKKDFETGKQAILNNQVRISTTQQIAIIKKYVWIKLDQNKLDKGIKTCITY